MRFVAGGLYFVAWLYLLILWARWVMELIMAFTRSWRPHGGTAIAFEVVYTVTDPPLKLLRRHIRPVGLGPVALDLAFPIVLLACTVLVNVAYTMWR